MTYLIVNWTKKKKKDLMNRVISFMNCYIIINKLDEISQN